LIITNLLNVVSLDSELNCVPDVSSLIEWSNWLTPFNSPRRYDTIFYLACLNTKPPCFPDSSEVSNFAWLTPQNAIHMQFKDDIRLAPPQFCDLSLANRFCSLSQIKDFTLYNLRNKTLQRNVSIRIRDKDGQRVVCIIKFILFIINNYWKFGLLWENVLVMWDITYI
jgi:nucleoside diphosphate-linked moiety X motif protein 19